MACACKIVNSIQPTKHKVVKKTNFSINKFYKNIWYTILECLWRLFLGFLTLFVGIGIGIVSIFSIIRYGRPIINIPVNFFHKKNLNNG